MTQQLELDLWREPVAAAPPPPARDPVRLAREQARELLRGVCAALGAPARLHLTDNRRTMLSSRREGATWVIRAHHLFLGAPPELSRAIALYLRDGDGPSGRAIDAYIAAKQDTVVASRERATVIHTRGRHHDLREIFDALAARCFSLPFGAQITWAEPRRVRGRRRSIQLGVYLAEQQLIRINPVLDEAWVPRFYVETIVHHEMLHHVVPASVEGGRRRVHTPRFRALERAFEHHDDARLWEASHLPRLLSGSR